MSWNRTRNNNCPCNGCTDRYPACSAHCEKEEFKVWKEKKEKAKAEERRYAQSMDLFSEAKKRKLWKQQRYSNHVKSRSSGREL